MKAVVVGVLALSACEHAGPKPTPGPIEQAHAEFELLPASAAAGTTQLYSHIDLAAYDLSTDRDEGDFIGRLRTLFGPRDGNRYVLRYKLTGVVITAYSTGDDGPCYGGTPDEAGQAARVAADPMLKTTDPPPGVTAFVYGRHYADAVAGPKNEAAVTRLDALISMVLPADFTETEYDSTVPSVWRIGAKGGHSFKTELPPAEGMAFLLARTKPDAYEPDVAVIEYYLTHEHELAADKPKALAALSHVEALAKHVEDEDERDELTEELQDFADALR